MTPKQRTTLARMSDGDWHTCRDTTGGVLSKLYRAGYIRCACERPQMIERLWTITPDGLAALEATE
jgi:hypothetical protein